MIPVSIIVPAYNCSNYLIKAVESLNDTFEPPAEIIIIDDCSTDDTPIVIQSIISRYPNVRATSTSVNSGAARARLIGLKLATYDVAGMLDGDDLVSPGAFAEAYRDMKSLGADLCSLSMEKIDNNGEFLYQFQTDIKPGETISGRKAAEKSLLNWGVYTNGLCYTRNWISAYEQVPVDLFDADELVSRNLLLNSKLVTLSKGRYLYRTNPESATQTKKLSLADVKKMNWLISFGIEHQLSRENQSLAKLHYWLGLSMCWKGLSLHKNKHSVDDELYIQSLFDLLKRIGSYTPLSYKLQPKILITSILLWLKLWIWKIGF